MPMACQLRVTRTDVAGAAHYGIGDFQCGARLMGSAMLGILARVGPYTIRWVMQKHIAFHFKSMQKLIIISYL